MSKHLFVHLSFEDREYLEKFIRAGVASTRALTRARILLLSDRSRGERRRQQQVAEATMTCSLTVSRVCRRYVLEGLEPALEEKPRPGAAPKIDGAVEAHLCLLACSDPPEGQVAWTLQLLGDKLVELGLVESIARSTVCERLKKTRLSPGGSPGSASASPRLST